MPEPAIAAHGLTKTFYGGIVAVNDLDLEVPRGSVYGLMGRNGSGKTTTLRLLMGLLRPDRGVARVLGWDFRQAPRTVRRRAAYVSQSQLLPPGLSLEELSHCLKRQSESWDPLLAEKLARRWSLPSRRALGCLSAGEQRKASLLVAFASRPEVLVLDEPAGGFDLVARRELVEEMVDAITQAEGCTILLSTHLVGDIERVADQVGVMESGGMALSVRLEDLLNETRRVQVIFEDEEAPTDFAIPGAVKSWGTGAVVSAIVRWPHGGELEALRSSTSARVQVFSTGLEEIFLELFGNTNRKDEELANKVKGNGTISRL